MSLERCKTLSFWMSNIHSSNQIRDIETWRFQVLMEAVQLFKMTISLFLGVLISKMS